MTRLNGMAIPEGATFQAAQIKKVSVETKAHQLDGLGTAFKLDYSTIIELDDLIKINPTKTVYILQLGNDTEVDLA